MRSEHPTRQLKCHWRVDRTSFSPIYKTSFSRHIRWCAVRQHQPGQFARGPKANSKTPLSDRNLFRSPSGRVFSSQSTRTGKTSSARFAKPSFHPRMSFPKAHRFGGAERDRTADPLLAKQVLSQLSYSPNRFDHLLQATHLSPKTKMVGPGRLELPTSRLSGVRSNHLSYGPIPGRTRPRAGFVILLKKEKRGRRASPSL